MSERSELWHRETEMNIFQGSMPRFSETIIVWSVEGGGSLLMGHPVVKNQICSISRERVQLMFINCKEFLQ